MDFLSKRVTSQPRASRNTAEAKPANPPPMMPTVCLLADMVLPQVMMIEDGNQNADFFKKVQTNPFMEDGEILLPDFFEKTAVNMAHNPRRQQFFFLVVDKFGHAAFVVGKGPLILEIHQVQKLFIVIF